MYSFYDLKNDLDSIKKNYPFIEINSIGKSVLNNDIYCVKLGRGKNNILYVGAFHANEYITSKILINFINDYGKSYYNSTLYNNFSIYVIPMLNPDGVNLVNGVYNNSKIYEKANKISAKYPAIPFPLGWKANIEGVDLNLQYPALWDKAKEIKYQNGFISPAPRDFVGAFPLSAPESNALFKFSKQILFDGIICFHTQGREIYWQFQNYANDFCKEVGQKIANLCNYTLANVPYNSSFAGFKDYYLQEYKKPSYTIEVGLGNNPLPFLENYSLYLELKDVLFDFPKLLNPN